MVFFVTTLSVTNSFIYRYLHLCRVELVEKVSTKQFILIGGLLNLIVVGNGFFIFNMAMLPSKRFVDFVTSTVIVDGIDMSRAAFFGFSLKYCMESFRLALIIELLLLMSLITSVNVFSSNVSPFAITGCLPDRILDDTVLFRYISAIHWY
uniref:7TM GPCR domain containing protein n=1 Tax=Haemonchus contortus TaxID=6289 RepID=W6NGU2_HAECO